MAEATIYEVAQRAGVSVATVSRAFNGGPVAPATKARVLAVAAELGYRPHRLAQGLASGRSWAVGVVVPDAAGPLYGRFERGLSETLFPEGYTYLASESRRQLQREFDLVEEFLSRKVDALVLVGSGASLEALTERFGRLPPTVLVEREGPDRAAVHLGVDHEAAAYRATRHLLATGHRRIAHVFGPRRAGRERRAGFLRALAEAGLRPFALVEGDFSEQSGYDAGRALLAKKARPDAVFLANDRMALGFYKAAWELGIAIPDQVSVVGFDDLRFAAYLTPPLTTMRQPAELLGRRAGAAVLALLAGQRPKSTVLPCELIARASVRHEGGEV